MKITKLKDLPGETMLDKLTTWSKGRPIYTQIKYNGVSARWDFRAGKLYTKTGHSWKMSRLPAALNHAITSLQVNVHGELLIPNTPLPTIAGAVNVSSDKPFPDNTYLAAFDAVDPCSPWITQPISARLSLLAEIDRPTNGLKVVNTWLLPADKVIQFFNELPSTVEGLVLRRDPCFPVFTDQPHQDIVKIKRIHHGEGICLEAIEGKGKRRGMLGAFILQLPNGRPLRVGGGAGMNDELLTKLWANPPIGKKITYSFEELSPAGIPLRPQFVTVRDYE